MKQVTRTETTSKRGHQVLKQAWKLFIFKILKKYGIRYIICIATNAHLVWKTISPSKPKTSHQIAVIVGKYTVDEHRPRTHTAGGRPVPIHTRDGPASGTPAQPGPAWRPSPPTDHPYPWLHARCWASSFVRLNRPWSSRGWLPSFAASTVRPYGQALRPQAENVLQWNRITHFGYSFGF